MDPVAFNRLVASEQSARGFFLSFCWKKQQRFCPHCKEHEPDVLSPGKYRCTRCNFVFEDFSQRFIKGCGFSFRQWLWFLKMFGLGVANQELAQQLKVSYATVLKAKDLMRRAILAQAMDANTYYELGIWPGPGRVKPPRELTYPPVFGVMDINGYVICDVLPEMAPKTLLHFQTNFQLRTSRIGHVLYTAPFQQYMLLACCSKEFSAARGPEPETAQLPADSLGFWIYTRQQLKQLRGVPPGRFPLYLKEWELRFNYCRQDLVSILAKALCGFVPNGAVPANTV